MVKRYKWQVNEQIYTVLNANRDEEKKSIVFRVTAISEWRDISSMLVPSVTELRIQCIRCEVTAVPIG